MQCLNQKRLAVADQERTSGGRAALHGTALWPGPSEARTAHSEGPRSPGGGGGRGIWELLAEAVLGSLPGMLQEAQEARGVAVIPTEHPGLCVHDRGTLEHNARKGYSQPSQRQRVCHRPSPPKRSPDLTEAPPPPPGTTEAPPPNKVLGNLGFQHLQQPGHSKAILGWTGQQLAPDSLAPPSPAPLHLRGTVCEQSLRGAGFPGRGT